MKMRSQQSRQQGIALVIVLWIIMLLSIMLGSFAYSMRTETSLATYSMERSQARSLAEAGIAYAAIRVMLSPDPENIWPVEGSVREWRFGQGVANISVIEAGGKIDLNQGNRELLIGLFMSVEVEEEQAQILVDMIEDWRDPDDARRLKGAEEDEYLQAGRAVGPKNSLFESVEELQQLLAMTPELYQQVKDLLTVHSHQPGINPAAASAAVFNAIPDIDPQEVESYIDERGAALEQGLPPPPPPPSMGPYLSQGQAQAYYVSVTAVLDTGTKTTVDSIITLGRVVGQAYYIASWREG